MVADNKNIMLGFKYRLYPNKKQRCILNQHMQLVKDLHNYLIDWCKAGYKKAKEEGKKFSPTAYTMNYEIAGFKKEHPEYKEVWGHALQGISNRLGKAYANFFRRCKEKKSGKKIKVGFPRYKKRLCSLLYPDQHGIGYKLESNKILQISKVGRVPIKLDRMPKGNIKTLVITRDGNRWFACFSADQGKIMGKIQKNRTAIGIDVGLTNFATLSDGTTIENPRFYKNAQKKLRRLQRRHSKKVKGSANRIKARMRLWKAHQRVQDLRDNFLHTITTDLVRRYNLIAVEDLKINNMLKNHHLAESIADAGWAKFTQYLSYKAESAGSQIVFVEPNLTSQICSECGRELEEHLGLPDRIFECGCGHREDRDVNAAKNILAKTTAGRAGSQACGETTSTHRHQAGEQAVSEKQELYGGRT